MNERDKELWVQSQQWDSSDDGRSKLKIFESVEKFAALTRADERKSIVAMLKDEVNVETAADCIWEIEARGNT